MADGEHKVAVELTLSEAMFQRLKTRSDKLGMTLDAAATEVIEQGLFDYDDYDWGPDPENDPRTATIRPFDPSEPTYSLEEVMTEFDAELERRLAEQR